MSIGIGTFFTGIVDAMASKYAIALTTGCAVGSTVMHGVEINKLGKIQAGVNSANAKLICIDRGQKELIGQIDEFVDCIDEVVDFPQANIQPGQPQPVTPTVAPVAEAPTSPAPTAAPATDEMAKMWAAINKLAAGGAAAPAPTAPVAPVAEAPTAPAATPTTAPAPAAVVNVGTAAPAPMAAPVTPPATEEYVTKAELMALIEGNNTTLLAGIKDFVKEIALEKADAAAGESAPPAGGKPKK